MTEEDWVEIQRRAIEAAERAPVSLAECLAGLEIMRVELQERIRQMADEIEHLDQGTAAEEEEP